MKHLNWNGFRDAERFQGEDTHPWKGQKSEELQTCPRVTRGTLTPKHWWKVTSNMEVSGQTTSGEWGWNESIFTCAKSEISFFCTLCWEAAKICSPPNQEIHLKKLQRRGDVAGKSQSQVQLGLRAGGWGLQRTDGLAGAFSLVEEHIHVAGELCGTFGGSSDSYIQK